GRVSGRAGKRRAADRFRDRRQPPDRGGGGVTGGMALRTLASHTSSRSTPTQAWAGVADSPPVPPDDLLRTHPILLVADQPWRADLESTSRSSPGSRGLSTMSLSGRHRSTSSARPWPPGTKGFTVSRASSFTGGPLDPSRRARTMILAATGSRSGFSAVLTRF